jgi:hypothetical protein
MGREVKRVEKSFKWSHGKTWPGFINPYAEYCPVCSGDNDECEYGKWVDDYEACIHPSFAEACTAWERIEPPVGDGYQLWETVSEGSPVSPVFESREALINWMRKNEYAEWAIQMVEDGNDWLPSGIVFG